MIALDGRKARSAVTNKSLNEVRQRVLDRNTTFRLAIAADFDFLGPDGRMVTAEDITDRSNIVEIRRPTG